METKELESFFSIIGRTEIDNHGDSKHGNIDKSGFVYHVTQQCWNHKNYFGFESARYRDYLLKSICNKTGVIPLMNVVMPNHSHDVLYSKDFSKIQSLYSVLNCKVSKFIQKDRLSTLNKETPLVFQNRPTYTLIENRNQLFYLIYYLYHNDDFLKESGKAVPYSCFTDWSKGNFKGYDSSFFQKLFDIPIEEILNLCSTLNKEDFKSFGSKHFAKYETKDIFLFRNSNTLH